MNLEEIQAVIESAEARGTDQLATYVQGRLPEASATEVQDAASVLLKVIESIPLILASATQGAEERNLAHVLQVLDESPGPLVDWDLDHPTSPVRNLLDEDVGQQFDAMFILQFEDVADDVRQTWGAEPLDA